MCLGHIGQGVGRGMEWTRRDAHAGVGKGFLVLYSSISSNKCRITYAVHLVRLLADSGIDYGIQRAIIVTRFAVLDLHRALSGARQQSDDVDSCAFHLLAFRRSHARGLTRKRVLWPIHSELLRMCTRLIRRPIPCATLFDVGELKKLEKVRVNA
jgi:hypothetical protein